MECMRIQNLRLRDFFKALDGDNSDNICISELMEGMLKVGVTILPDTLRRLFKKLDKDGNQMLDYKEMIEAQKFHKNNIGKARQEKVDLNETEIGKISDLIRKVMEKDRIRKSD
ncbi:hypothetical protein DPMN_001470 [Dreissena polymorpha]|uniref:EF-hand domain-containing protein n=1 Tax=Dreissena polymorpha TaxID=45954 RepID=A0A9D4MHT4_DREPO|nr:hypothetical protein DPMN_001470 [Dreissena polymorpha]